jgi:putative SOS response-associated peptidase YedK
VPLEPDQWEQWLTGGDAEPRALLVAPPAERFGL